MLRANQLLLTATGIKLVTTCSTTSDTQTSDVVHPSRETEKFLVQSSRCPLLFCCYHNTAVNAHHNLIRERDRLQKKKKMEYMTPCFGFEG